MERRSGLSVKRGHASFGRQRPAKAKPRIGRRWRGLAWRHARIALSQPSAPKLFAQTNTNSVRVLILLESQPRPRIPSLFGSHTITHTLPSHLTMDQAAYDALSPSERAAHDAAALARQEAEQAALPYKWTQALDHVAVSLPLSEGTKARMLDVAIKKKSIRVARKGAGGEVLMEGEFPKEVRADESVWSIGESQLVAS